RSARPAPRREEPAATGGWRGDVEPIPFPFRFGVGGMIRPRHFAFDHAGEGVLAAADHGGPYPWRADGTPRAHPPRGGGGPEGWSGASWSRASSASTRCWFTTT